MMHRLDCSHDLGKDFCDPFLGHLSYLISADEIRQIFAINKFHQNPPLGVFVGGP